MLFEELFALLFSKYVYKMKCKMLVLLLIVPFLSQAKLVEARMKNTSIPTDTPPALAGDTAETLEPAHCWMSQLKLNNRYCKQGLI